MPDEWSDTSVLLNIVTHTSENNKFSYIILKTNKTLHPAGECGILLTNNQAIPS
jgi:hypothetical protein